jgi:predicted choloylglycine hydrolase
MCCVLTRNEQVVTKQYYLGILEGSSYDVGYAIAKNIKKFPNKNSFISEKTVNSKKIGFNNFNDFQDSLEQTLPGITDEIQGFCDGLNLNPKKVQFFHMAFIRPKNCSQLAVLPAITSNKHVMVAYSNEWSYLDPTEDLAFIKCKIGQKYRHFSYMSYGFGRGNGFNEKGLGIFINSGGAWSYPLTQRGFGFSVFVRAILERCANVDQALDLIQELTVAEPYVFSIVDQQGNAIHCEWLDGKHSIAQVGESSELQYLCATNHYSNPDMVQYNSYNEDVVGQESFLENSKTRSRLLKALVMKHQPNITKNQLKELLSGVYPNGLSAHFYREGFGTMYSLIVDLSEHSLDICFGPPKYNKWYRLRPFAEEREQYFDAIFPKT